MTGDQIDDEVFGRTPHDQRHFDPADFRLIVRRIWRDMVRTLAWSIVEINGYYTGRDPRGILKSNRDIVFKTAHEIISKLNNVNLQTSVVRETSQRLVTYLKIYNVDMKSLDPYKVAYWYWESLLGLYPSVHPIGKILRMGLAVYMWKLLLSDTKKTLDPMMFHKIKQTLLEGRDEEIFGKYGLYMIFKNCAKQCYHATEEYRAHCPIPPSRTEAGLLGNFLNEGIFPPKSSPAPNA
ncbi:MAG: hypothetical protein HQL51_12605 [Magnetococcales bacterium]|nr:hypothetical protein [Magnetococcales bacterium]